jgi:hypothetical protein
VSEAKGASADDASGDCGREIGFRVRGAQLIFSDGRDRYAMI